MLKGKIHSIETCGMVDGPGVRFVIFMQGCPLRCKYCHNPDSQKIGAGREITVDELAARYMGVKEFVKSGVTATGGEPLIQIEFVTELFKKFKGLRVHTALDTSGITFNYTARFDELLKYTDLVLLDIKHIDSDEHKKLTGSPNKSVLDFAKYLNQKSIPTRIRYVLVRGITDKKKDLERLGKFLAELGNIEGLEILPYHTMAIPKYRELGLNYPLEGILPTTKDEVKAAYGIIFDIQKTLFKK